MTSPDRAFERLLERRDRKRRHERVAAASVALVIAFGVIGGGILLLSGLLGGHAQPGSGDTNQVDPRLVLGSGEYFYLGIRSSESADGYIRDEQTWWALAGSGEVRNESTRQDKYPLPRSGVYDPGQFPIEADLSELSTDPETLATQLRTVSPFAEMFACDPGAACEPEPRRRLGLIGMLLTFPNATPDLRAALFEVASETQGVRTIEGVQDPGERTAVALSFAAQSEDVTWTWYFDPATRQVMAMTSKYDDNAPAWTVFESAIVGAPGVQPAGDQWLVAQPSLPEDTTSRS
jgi:hypothetical protein